MGAECLDYTVPAPPTYCVNYHSASLQASCRYTNRPEAWVHVKARSYLEAENCTFDHDGYISDGRGSDVKLTLNMRCVLMCSYLWTFSTRAFSFCRCIWVGGIKTSGTYVRLTASRLQNCGVYWPQASPDYSPAQSKATLAAVNSVFDPPLQSYSAQPNMYPKLHPITNISWFGCDKRTTAGYACLLFPVPCRNAEWLCSAVVTSTQHAKP